MNKIPDHILRRIAQDQFRNCNNSPGSWGLSAHRLYTASLPIAAMISEAEERKFKRMETRAPENGSYQLSDEETQDMWIGQTSAVWAMLIGLAFENLLKGIIIGREGLTVGANSLTVQSNGELPLKKTHKLGELAKRADFGGVDDYELFEFFYEFSVWRGRYHTSVREEEEYTRMKRNYGKPPTISLWPISEISKKCDDIYKKLWLEIEIVRATPPKTIAQ